MKKQLTSKMTWLQVGLAILSCLVAVLVTSHNDQFYDNPIYKVTAVTNGKPNKVTDEFENEDHQTEQKLQGYITNGKHKNQRLSIDNTYSDSNAMDHKLKVGDKVFITFHNKHSATVKDLKRDVPVVFLIALAISLLCVLLKFQGLTVVGSIIVNTVLFFCAIKINNDHNGAHVILNFAVLSLIFCVITLWMVMGWNKKMLVALTSVVGSTVGTILIMLVAFMITHEKGVYYESMQYVTQLPKPLFVAEVLVGVLGAVMDEATDIVASLATLKKEKPEISARQVFDSGRQIGKSIMGPLINVLFFVFMAETLPMTLLYLKNGNSWGYSFSMNMSLGVLSSLVSAIGIVLTVVLSSFFASIWIKGDES
ncbi:YibE/F family protein [Lentilactobacillus sp. Marseille-Q4993]|uniref:YibE/F family protein n=1 Tax=Lentilactobacillus sp. Marseille-Q4993 TaxID=3039492 RepID=UPI0024BCFD82|nr:YibE/F family protein [Lentilactobacillus sp. Marseille-Q4993]